MFQQSHQLHGAVRYCHVLSTLAGAVKKREREREGGGGGGEGEMRRKPRVGGVGGGRGEKRKRRKKPCSGDVEMDAECWPVPLVLTPPPRFNLLLIYVVQFSKKVFVSRFGLAVRQKGLASIPLRLSFLFKKGCCLWTPSCDFVLHN